MNEVIFAIIELIGGLAFFLYGMNEMSDGLKKIAGGRLESTLGKMTSNAFRGLTLGCIITIAIQSSSAMTVMLVGLVNSGLMTLSQTLSVIMGSNIGTTLTAWILSLSGLSGENLFLRLLKPESFAPVVAIIGAGLIMMSKKVRRRDIGRVLIGFAILMTGMTVMSAAVKPLTQQQGFADMLTAFSNPILGLLIGTVFTGIVQSSAATMGILQALSISGGITYGMAIPIVFGLNIGTCMTSLLSAIGVNKNAKRVAVLHTVMKSIGAVVFLALFYGLNAAIGFPFVKMAASPVGIAIVHTIFNILNTVMLMPFGKLLIKLVEKLVPDKAGEQKFALIDERLLDTPSFAIMECDKKTVEMAHAARDSVELALNLTDKFSEEKASEILAKEDFIDGYEDKLGTYLVKLSSKELSDKDARAVSRMLHSIGDLERLGDHAVNILKTAREMKEKSIRFSPEATAEIAVAKRALYDIIRITFDAFDKNDVDAAKNVEPLEQVIDGLVDKIKYNHIERLQSGTCTIELGFVLSDLLSNFERISDHCSNIAVTIIETQNDSYKTHEYLNIVKTVGDEHFSTKYSEYSEKYSV